MIHFSYFKTSFFIFIMTSCMGVQGVFRLSPNDSCDGLQPESKERGAVILFFCFVVYKKTPPKVRLRHKNELFGLGNIMVRIKMASFKNFVRIVSKSMMLK